MSNLSIRVQKAKQLNFVDIPGLKITKGACEGSKGDHYEVSLFQKKEWEKVQVADTEIKAVVISVTCQQLDPKYTNGLPMCDCQGNSRHTVCYHSLGYLKFKLAQRDKQISFYQDVLSALNGLNFGGQLTKVISKQGEGYVWAVVRETQILTVQENINLMRGAEDDEGID